MRERQEPTQSAVTAVAAIALAGALAACETITVPRDDATPPFLFVTLPDSESLGAVYISADRSREEEGPGGNDNLDNSRRLSIRPASPDTPIRFHFHAFDHDSGIERANVALSVHFNCQTQDVRNGAWVSRSGQTASYFTSFGRPTPVGGSTVSGDSRFIVLTLNGAWDRAHCPRTGAHAAEMTDIRISYEATAFNNRGRRTVAVNREISVRQTFIPLS